MADAIAVLCLIIASTWQPKQHDIHIFKPTRIKSFQFQATLTTQQPNSYKKLAFFLRQTQLLNSGLLASCQSSHTAEGWGKICLG
jgi:hypothetical protein